MFQCLQTTKVQVEVIQRYRYIPCRSFRGQYIKKTEIKDILCVCERESIEKHLIMLWNWILLNKMHTINVLHVHITPRTWSSSPTTCQRLLEDFKPNLHIVNQIIIYIFATNEPHKKSNIWIHKEHPRGKPYSNTDLNMLKKS